MSMSHCLVTYFDQTAKDYNQHAFIPKLIAKNLFERLDLYDFFTPQRILDLGCGTGFCLQLLENRYPKAELYGLDLSHAVLKRIQKDLENFPKLIQADLEQIPIAPAQFDLICASLSMMWIKDLPSCFKKIYRLLKPNGLFLMTSLGLDTFKEINCHQKTFTLYPHAFYDMHTIGDFLVNTAWQDIVLDTHVLQTNYSTLYAFKDEIKKLGLDNLFVNHDPYSLKKVNFQSQKFSVTWEIIYSQAWKKLTQKTSDDLEQVFIPITAIKRSL